MHLRPCVVVVATLALRACGSGAGSLDGKIQGHDTSVKEAVFLDFGNNQVFLAAGNEDHICEVLTGYAACGHGLRRARDAARELERDDTGPGARGDVCASGELLRARALLVDTRAMG